MTLRLNNTSYCFDPYFWSNTVALYSGYLEQMFENDWTLDPAIFNYKISYRPAQYAVGDLAQSWEFTNPGTYVVHLRQGIHWQNIAPANGREFIASDVVYHYDRLYGLGYGYTKPAPGSTTIVNFVNLTSVTAPDKYTVVFQWKITSPEFISEQMMSPNASQCIVNPEAVQQWGDVNDWHHAVGTGPFLLGDFVAGSSVTMVKNPNYWGHDEHYLQNQLPYIDTLKLLIIPDNATALAAMRTGKIDAMDGISFTQAQAIQKTNPEILQTTTPMAYGTTVDPRNDKAPFNDIRVREAMQMSIDLPTIAATYYGGSVDPYPVELTSRYMTGWGFPYEQWPQDLKDQFAYNPTAAKQLLAAAGYPNGFNTNIVVDNSADLDLLQIVKAYFAAVNINMSIQTMDTASMNAFVFTGHKQDALAMRAQGSIGSGVEPMRQFTYFQTTSATNYMQISSSIYDGYSSKALAATSIDEVKQILKDANELVARQHFTISLLQPNNFDLYQPWLKGYSGQAQSISGNAATGFEKLFFYPARFWIDQTLKK